MADRNKKNQVRVLFPIGAKLVIFFALVLFTALIIINNLMSGVASRELQVNAEDAGAEVNNLLAAEAEDGFYSVRKEVYLLLDFIRIAGKDSSLARQVTALFFERSYFIAAVFVPGYTQLVNDQFFAANDLSVDTVSSWVSREEARIERARQGEPEIINPSADLGAPLIAMFYPWQQNNREEAVVVFFSPDGLAELLGNGNGASFVANKDGELLVHNDYQMVPDGTNVSAHPLFTALLNTDAREIRLAYTENGVKFFGTGRKLSLGNLMVFSTIEYDKLFKGTSGSSRRNIFLIISIIFISGLFMWLLSKTITIPVRRLVEAVSRAEAGQFDGELSYRFPDEIGVLSDRFSAMGNSLAKQDKPQPHKKSRK